MAQFGEVPPDWSPKGWAVYCRYLAARCAADHPNRAAELKKWADKVCRDHGITLTAALDEVRTLNDVYRFD